MPNSKIDITEVPTMTSLEIAEVTGKRRNHVLRDIEVMLNELEIGESIFESTYLDKSNRQSKMYVLPKRESLILVSGYSIKMRAAIIDRWTELESIVAADGDIALQGAKMRQVGVELRKQGNSIIRKADDLVSEIENKQLDLFNGEFKDLIDRYMKGKLSAIQQVINKSGQDLSS